LLLELLDGDFPRFEVVEFASFAPLNWRAILLPEKPSDSDLHVSPSAWNRLSAEAGVVSGLQSWNRRLRALERKQLEDFTRSEAVTEAKSPASAAAAARQGREFHLRVKTFQISKLLEFLGTLDQWRQKFQSCRTWSDFSEATKEAIELFFYRSPTSQAEDPQVWDQLITVIDAIATLEQVDADASLTRWISALRETLENDRVRSGRFQSGGVSVLSVMGSRGTRHRVVIVPGMAERGFPLLSRQDSVLLDWERTALNQVSSAGLPLKSMRVKEEKLLFQTCACAARERLVLTLPRLEAQGSRSRLPSHYLIGVAEALAGAPQDFETLEELPQFDRVALSELAPEESQDALTENQFALRALRDPSEVPASLYKNVLQRSLSAYRARWSDQFTPHDGQIQSIDLIARIAAWADTRRMSPSALEMFATCSYKFFLRQLLGLEKTEEPEDIETLSALDKGTLVHHVLDTYMRRAHSLGWFPLARSRAGELHQLMDEIADKDFAETEEKGITGYRLLWELASERIRADLHAFVEREIDRQQQFIPDRFEAGFGRAEYPVELKLAGGRALNLSGRIDRIDLNNARTAIRVVDYKTGKNRLDEKAEFQGGKKLQLAIYLMAAAKIYGLKDLEESLAEYYFVSSDGEFGVHSFTGEDWEAKLERLTQLLSTLHGAILQGLFPVDPGVSGDHCDWCDYTLICDKAVQRIHGFKSRSPLLQFKQELGKFE
jgi:ATP-dependent helicase/DNAse subunit B